MDNLQFTEPPLDRLSHELKRSGLKHFRNRLRFQPTGLIQQEIHRTELCERALHQSDADHIKYE